MERRPWFELHDHPRYPRFLRDMVTDGLEHTWNVLDSYRSIQPRLQKAILQSGATQVLDLCSGGGGPWLSLAPGLQDRAGHALPIVLTDRFPNIPAFRHAEQISGGRIRYSEQPIDAQNVPESLSGFRTIFSSFHHFSPQQAQAMLADAFRRRQGIGVFELARPRPLTIALCFAMPAANWLLTPTMRPLGWRRLLFTYLVPAIPFTLWFDGVLSCLRSYSPADLRELVQPFQADDYRWEIGEAGSGKAKVTFLIGSPAKPLS